MLICQSSSMASSSDSDSVSTASSMSSLNPDGEIGEIIPYSFEPEVSDEEEEQQVAQPEVLEPWDQPERRGTTDLWVLNHFG